MIDNFKPGDIVIWCDEHIAYILEENVPVEDPISLKEAQRLLSSGEETPTSNGIKILLVDTEEIFDVHVETVSQFRSAFVNNQIKCNVLLNSL